MGTFCTLLVSSIAVQYHQESKMYLYMFAESAPPDDLFYDFTCNLPEVCKTKNLVPFFNIIFSWHFMGTHANVLMPLITVDYCQRLLQTLQFVNSSILTLRKLDLLQNWCLKPTSWDAHSVFEIMEQHQKSTNQRKAKVSKP